MADLEKDNGVNITDNDNNPIVEGDFCILEVKGKEKKVYKRMNISGLDQWVIDSKKSIQNIIENEKKEFYNSQHGIEEEKYDINTQKCNSIYSDYFNFDLNEPNCSFELDNFECLNYDNTVSKQQIKHKEELIASLENEISFYRNLNKDKKIV